MATLCAKYHGRDTKAKGYEVWVKAKPPREGQRGAKAKDGKFVMLGEPLCGTHLNALGYSVHRNRVSVALVEDYRQSDGELNYDRLLDRLVQVYEGELDEQEKRAEADLLRWQERSRREATEVEVYIKRDDLTFFRGSVYGVELWANGGESFHSGPVSSVSVSTEDGVAKVTVTDFLNGGSGRGNLSWLKALKQALDEAEAAMVAYNNKKGV